MYLSDRELTALLPALNFQTSDPDFAFNPNQQIQPCSIDLRLDSVFWRSRSKREIDLRKPGVWELSPRRFWKRYQLQSTESIVLNPGELVLGRTYETFSMPVGCAGHVEGRSSFGRLGLAVHCTASFINPGWTGHMPVQLMNWSRNPIRLIPRVPVCQLLVIQLSSEPERLYGDQRLSSKYMEDDGGPSYWWRDAQIRKLQCALEGKDLELRTQDELISILGEFDADLIDRFDAFTRTRHLSMLSNSEELLEAFAHSEGRRKVQEQIGRGLLVGSAPVLLSASLSSLFSQPFGWTTYGWLHYVLWTVTLFSLPISFLGLRWELPEYFTVHTLDELRRKGCHSAQSSTPEQ